MAKKMLIDAIHAEETRVVVLDGARVEEFDFEAASKRQLGGNIYLAKVTRVEPSLQAAFIEYGGNRHGFLAFSEIHPDYYQIPVADRQALLEEEEEAALADRAEDDDGASETEASPEGQKRGRRRPRRSSSSRKSAEMRRSDPVISEVASPSSEENQEEEPLAADVSVAREIAGMETIDLGDDINASISSEFTSMEFASEAVVSEDSKPLEGEVNPSVAPEEQPVSASVSSTSDEAEEDHIEDVSSDDSEEIRPRRKPRQKQYKIQEVIKVRQILLVQVVKEERGNKGAALTTYLSLAGRYCVLMPNTARGGGISRKITHAADRSKLKEIAGAMEVPRGAGLIIRTAGANRTKAEIKRDYEYLQRLWERIRELTLRSIAPTKVYEEGDLIKRSIRDLYSREIDEVLVQGELGYRTAKDFMKMIMPSHAKNVKHYQDSMPLYARYQVESTLAGMFDPTVQLKSGGYIVIGVTEALVAIDVNSGKATRQGSIEETALKTNMEAAEEIARQLKLRDLAGLIVIDFIDMEDRKNNQAVEKRLKEKLKSDRARIQVGRISGFGLLEMSRQRMRPGMLEATTQPCPSCLGTGLIRSDDSSSLAILRQLEEEGGRKRFPELVVRCPVNIANFLINYKREHIAEIEARYGISVRVEADVSIISPNFEIERVKQAIRKLPKVEEAVISGDSKIMKAVDAAETEDASEADASIEAEEVNAEEDKPKKKRRRSRGGRRSRGRKDSENNASEEALSSESSGEDKSEDHPASATADAVSSLSEEQAEGNQESNAGEVSVSVELPPAEPLQEERNSDQRIVPSEPSAIENAPSSDVLDKEDAASEQAVSMHDAPEAVLEVAGDAAGEVVEVQEAPPKPKRRGWWSVRRS